MTAKTGGVRIGARDLAGLVARMFESEGLSHAAATTVAGALVDADLEGQHSHGVMLVDMYLGRLRAGSVSRRETADVVTDHGGVTVLDAGHAFGHLTGDQAMGIAVAKAREFGTGIVAVRHAFHFGVARRYALAAAGADCVGMVMCNTRPLMPAPGGAERVVGNNPLAIAIPTDGSTPMVLDMAMSEAAMGRIRMAAKIGEAIPPNWAVRSDGTPTTDPGEAITGMLLPAAGPKGFGLALMIDMLCGLLSGGAWGGGVQPLYGDFSVPYDCSQLFMAINLAHFGEPGDMRRQVLAAAECLRASPPAPGTDRLFTPGEIEWQRGLTSDGTVRVDASVAAMLVRMANECGIEVVDLADTRDRKVDADGQD